MFKAEFSASLLQSSVSHDPSEISLTCWFAAQEHLKDRFDKLLWQRPSNESRDRD